MDTNTPEASAVLRWLLAEGRFAGDAGELVAALSMRLAAAGVPLVRATTHARTLHPEFRWMMREWQRGGLVAETRREHGVEATPVFRGNPVEHVVATGDWLDLRRGDEFAARFPVVRDLFAHGITHYVMAPLPQPAGRAAAASWATDVAGGFLPEQVALLRAIADALALVLEACVSRRLIADLLGAYVGRDPARRILDGTIRRGEVSRIDAAIMMTDLRGFGRLADTMTEERVVALLDDYFDCVVPNVHAHNGDILKFLGDGVLAIFPARSGAVPVQAALRAARDSLAALAARNAAGGPGGTPVTMGIALHSGQVAYGNVGSGDRLDFTAIGRDVNVAARLEKLCEPMGQPLLMTRAFVAGLDVPVREVGTHHFKGFRDPERIYTIAD